MAAVMDEIGELVSTNLVPMEQARLKKRVADSLLPCERTTGQWPNNIALAIDESIASRFPLLNIDEVLKMKHAKKFGGIVAPRFAVFDAFKNEPCVLQVWNWGGDQEKENGATSALRSYAYRISLPQTPAATDLAILEGRGRIVPGEGATDNSISWGGGRTMMVGSGTEVVTLSASFVGVIPTSVRQLIRDNRAIFDCTMLVQEVVEWNAKVEQIADPLVVGIKNGVAYLVDRFDTTTMEEYVAREFSANE